jgi:nucleoside-diphosphate-sugar epimerase
MGFWKEKCVLVTGGAGFIGSHLVDILIEKNAYVTIADDLSTGSLDNVFEVWAKYGLDPQRNGKKIVAANQTFFKCDLEDKNQVADIVKDQEIVFHLAANIGGRGYIDTHPAECCKNFAVNHNVIEEAFKANVERIHYSSTACVYPTSLQSKYDSGYLLKESDAFKNGWANCDGEYGWSKFMGELELLAFHRENGLKCSISRYVTAYGERENDTHAIISLIRRAIERHDPYLVWGNGKQDRDFTYVSDIVNGTLLSAEKITDGTPLNLGTSKRYKIRDVVDRILEITNYKPREVIFDKTKPVGVLSRALDISKSKRLLSWEPKVSLEEGLKRTVNWFAKVRPKIVETIE